MEENLIAKRISKRMIILAILLIMLSISGITVSAQTDFPPPPEPIIDNADCLACHSQPDQRVTLPSGEILFITIDEDEYNQSVHGVNGYACVQCHTNHTEYPHQPIEAQTLREYKLEQYKSCARCHGDKYDALMDSVHEKAIENGNIQAAVCTDCHGSHYIKPPDEPRSLIPQTCGNCHSEIDNAYLHSVHGEALVDEGNPDVPSCTDCHGSHNIKGPTGSNFKLNSPLICAKCHADEELMNKYNISTNVFDSYVADFHGTTSTLFEPEVEGQQPDTPVCVDCHGVHDIKSPDDPESSVMKENLLVTCQKCHPDASANFPTAWLGHYEPDRERYPIVFYVDLFYKIFIPGVLGVMVLFVGSDAIRRIINKRRERTQ